MNNNDSGKEFIDKLQTLIDLRVGMRLFPDQVTKEHKEGYELLRRDLIDYLNLSDHRKGLMVKGPHE